MIKLNKTDMSNKKTALKLCISASLILHVFILAIPLAKISFYERPQPQFKVRSIQTNPDKPILRTVGKKDGKDDVFSIKDQHRKGKSTKGPTKLADLRALGLNQGFFQPKQIAKKKAPQVAKKKSIRAFSLNETSISSLLQDTPNAQNAGVFEKAMKNTESMVNVEVPKGVLESELNEYELVYYAFQKRTAVSYVSSFYKKLDQFKLQNPHLNFPMTTQQKKLTGRVTYDAKGNIVRIKMIKWSDSKHLQDFFEGVLREMNVLPNPPDTIVEDGEFTVFFSLNLNGRG